MKCTKARGSIARICAPEHTRWPSGASRMPRWCAAFSRDQSSQLRFFSIVVARRFVLAIEAQIFFLRDAQERAYILVSRCANSKNGSAGVVVCGGLARRDFEMSN